MARIRRAEQTASQCKELKIWKSALYIRLSREDGDKEESDSIQNQRALLTDFTERDESLLTADVYVDDGYSGTNFERPDFSRMMEDIRKKSINCVVVKDLSRFGRNYIESGRYLEQIFPFLGVRFISVNDLLDSFKNPQSMNNLLVPFKNIINDEYCRDISNKVRSTLDRKRRDGKFIGAFACYGYRKDPADKNHLLIDEEAAEIIRQIFRWHVGGFSVLSITRKLNGLGILNPAAYKKRQSLNYRHTSGEQNDTLWHDRTVRRILHNEMYLGNLVQGVSRVQSYKLQKARSVPPEDWIIVENTHEPIVDRPLFEQVQELLRRDTRTAPQSEQLSLFSGFLRCADCGKAMVKKKVRHSYGEYIYYYCATYKKMDRGACTKHTIREGELEQAVLASIQKQVELAVEMDELIEVIHRAPAVQYRSVRLERSLAEQAKELDRLRELRRSLYEDWKGGDITREEYHDLKARYEADIDRTRERLARLEQDQQEAERGDTAENTFLQSFLKHKNIPVLSREILMELVDQILVHEGKKITIRFKFADECRRVQDFIDSNQIGSGPDSSAFQAELR